MDSAQERTQERIDKAWKSWGRPEPKPLRVRLDAGEFEPATPRPLRPARPPKPLPKAVLTEEQARLQDLEWVKFAEANALYEQTLGRHHAELQEKMEEFQQALCEEHGVPPASEFGRHMAWIAWDRGHGKGYLAVFSEFQSLLPLWEAALKMVEEAHDQHPD